MQVNVQEAKSQLSKLIEAALRGEEVVIARDHKPAVRLVAVEAPQPYPFGLLKGQLGEGPDFFEPMDEEGLRLWEGRGGKPGDGPESGPAP